MANIPRAGFSSSAAIAALMVACTIVMTAVVVKREFFTKAAAISGRPNAPPELAADWGTVSAVGHRIGPEHAKITVVVFSDFECPACKRFETTTFPAFEKEHPGNVVLVYRHWPLEMHRFAYPAARASECAAAQGRFKEFHDVVFENQQRLGLKTFSEMARAAGLKDLVAFEACNEDSSAVASVEADIKAVTSLKGTGTPTVLVNGWLLRSGATLQRLDSIVAALKLTARND